MENTLPSSTFTFIANYKGGTYIRQVSASDISAACHTWAEQLSDKQDIQDLNADKFLQAFKEDIEELPPQPLRDIPNVWAFSVSAGRAFMLVNIVKTAVNEEQAPPIPAAAAVRGGSNAKP